MKWFKKETNQDKIEFYLNVLLALSKNTKLSSYERNKYIKILNNITENIS